LALLEEIKKKQRELVVLAQKKNNVLNDPEVYEFSCVIDELIVELMKSSKEKEGSCTWKQ